MVLSTINRPFDAMSKAYMVLIDTGKNTKLIPFQMTCINLISDFLEVLLKSLTLLTRCLLDLQPSTIMMRYVKSELLQMIWKWALDYDY